MGRVMKDLSALTAPPNFAGSAPKIMSDTDSQTRVEKSVNSKTMGKGTEPSEAAKATVHLAVAIVAVAAILLWILGGIVFRNANI